MAGFHVIMMKAINIQLPKFLYNHLSIAYVNKNIFLILSNAANLARFALHRGDWQNRSGPLRIDVMS